MMNKTIGFVFLAAILAVAGCGSSDNSTAQEEANFKKHDASAMKPPSGDQMKPPANFSSSLDNNSAKPPAGSTPSAPGGK